MKNTSSLLLPVVFGLFALLLAGCAGETELYIQGKWARGNVHFWDEWNFDRGTYWHEYDDGHTHIYERGRYSIIESGEDSLLLELHDQEGALPSIEDRVELPITIYPETDTAKIHRQEYTRVLTSSLIELTTQRAP